MIPVTIFAGRNIAVLGLGVSGLAVARGLKAGGANPVVWDDKEAAREEAAKQGFRRAVVPEANRPRKNAKVDIGVLPVARLRQALELL